MKLTISTEVLQRLMARAVKGVGGDRSNPLTSLICLKLERNVLTAVTTDGVNYLYVKESCEGDDFYVVAEVEQLSKLVSKLTCEAVELTVADKALEIKGNGKYRIELPLDEGEYVVYPDPISEMDLANSKVSEACISSVKAVVSSLKSFLATSFEVPCYRGYYIGESAVATDNCIMGSVDADLLGTAVLLSSRMLDLVSLTTADTSQVYITDDVIAWVSPDCAVYGPLMEGLEDYPVEGIKNYLNQDMDSKCEVDKGQLLDALGRIALFVGAYDDGVIKLTFTNKNLSIESKQSTGVETISYLKAAKSKGFSGLTNVEELINLVKAYPENHVKIQYGSDRALKLAAGSLSFVIAWAAEDKED